MSDIEFLVHTTGYIGGWHRRIIRVRHGEPSLACAARWASLADRRLPDSSGQPQTACWANLRPSEADPDNAATPRSSSAVRRRLSAAPSCPCWLSSVPSRLACSPLRFHTISSVIWLALPEGRGDFNPWVDLGETRPRRHRTAVRAALTVRIPVNLSLSRLSQDRFGGRRSCLSEGRMEQLIYILTARAGPAVAQDHHHPKLP